MGALFPVFSLAEQLNFNFDDRIQGDTAKFGVGIACALDASGARVAPMHVKNGCFAGAFSGGSPVTRRVYGFQKSRLLPAARAAKKRH